MSTEIKMDSVRFVIVQDGKQTDIFKKARERLEQHRDAHHVRVLERFDHKKAVAH